MIFHGSVVIFHSSVVVFRQFSCDFLICFEGGLHSTSGFHLPSEMAGISNHLDDHLYNQTRFLREEQNAITSLLGMHEFK